ncbi:FkbM family methyltransferase, partial [Burkholderia multivorans]
RHIPRRLIVPDPRLRDWLLTTKSPANLRAEGFPVE